MKNQCGMLGLSARYRAWLVTLCCLLFAIFYLNVVQAAPQSGLLTVAEKNWLKDHPVLRVVVDPDYLPFEALDQAGNYYGIGANYTDLIAERLGVEIKIISTKTWSESLALVKDRQADVLPILSTSPRRSEYLNFAAPHIDSPTMILTREDYPEVKGLQDFKGKQVALIKNYSSFTLTHEKHPEIVVVPVETLEQAIWAVAKGQAEAAVVDAVVANYYLQYHNVSYLKLAAHAQSLGVDQMGYGVRKDWPEFIPILNKALASITPEESIAIRSKWGGSSKPQVASLRLELSAEEQQWLQAHSVIRVGVDPDFAPFEWIDEQGRYIGLAADYMDLLAKRLGVTFRVESNLSWVEAWKKGQLKQLDIHPLVAPTSERKKTHLFTRTYVHDPYVIIGRKDQKLVAGETDLAHKKVALVKDYSATEFLLSQQPDVIPFYVETELESLLAVVGGEAEATVGHLGTLTEKIRINHLVNLTVAARIPFENESKGMGIAVRDDWPMLRDLLDRALASISQIEKREISQRWVEISGVASSPTVQVPLTVEERAWLREHPLIRVASDPAWAPLEFIDDKGELQGVSRDYLEQLEDMLEVRFEVAKDLSWQEMVEQVKNQQLDMFSSLRMTPDRQRFLHFSDPYLSQPIMIFAGTGISYIGGLEQLAGKRVGVVESYATQELLATHHPDIEVVVSESIKAALRQLAKGNTDVYVGNIITTTYYLNQLGLTQIKVVGETPYRHDQTMAVRQDWPLFATILSKALQAIPKEEHNAILRRWVPVDFEYGFDYRRLWTPALVLLLIFAVIFYWNRRLAKEVIVRKQIERDLKLHQQRLDDVFKVTPSGIWDWDMAKDNMYCSPAYFHMLGYSPEEFSDHDSHTIWLNLMHPDDLDATLEQYDNKAATAEPFSQEFRLRCKDGSYKWILDRGQVMARDETGRAIRMVGAYVDIDAFKQLESQLRDARDEAEGANLTLKKQKRIWELILSNIPSQVFWKDRDLKYLGCSHKFAEVVGLDKPENIVGKTDYDFARNSDYSESYREVDRAVIETGQPIFDVEETYSSLVNGENIKGYVISSKVPLRDNDGDIFGVLGVATDITEIKRIEHDLAQSKGVAETANEAKSTFLTNMSHELRTPLNAVLGFSELMMRDAQTTPSQNKFLRLINSSGHHLLNLINDVLDMSKIEAGKSKLDISAVNLPELLQDVTDMMGIQASEKGLQLMLEPSLELPHKVLFDVGKIKQVLINLLGNAIKFTEAGSVTLRVNKLMPAHSQPRLHFEVQDTGIGVDNEKIAHIFDAFRQVGGVVDNQKGTGLGLAISSQFVELMGGELLVESVLGEGTIFRFDIPVEMTDEIPEKENKRQVLKLSAGQPEWRILIVEDNGENRLLLKNHLVAAGFKVSEAVNGEQGIQQFINQQPHLIWMDMRMPVMDGFEATRRIRELPGGQQVTILALTATAFSEKVSDILASGCDEVFYKPFAAQTVFEAMGKYLELQYDYHYGENSDDDFVECGPVDLHGLPQEWQIDMLKAAKVGDVEVIGVLIESLDDEHEIVKSTFRQYLNEFQIECIMQLLEEQSSLGSDSA